MDKEEKQKEINKILNQMVDQKLKGDLKKAFKSVAIATGAVSVGLGVLAGISTHSLADAFKFSAGIFLGSEAISSSALGIVYLTLTCKK